jgi:hypothetical protein
LTIPAEFPITPHFLCCNVDDDDDDDDIALIPVASIASELLHIHIHPHGHDRRHFLLMAWRYYSVTMRWC